MTRALPFPHPEAVTPDAARGLTRAEVARMLSISPKRVRALGIPCIRLGYRTVRYLSSDVLDFLRSRRSA